jgi:hypothetical protein
MLSNDKAKRDHVRSLLRTKDFGGSWLRGGWKEEKDADSIGLEIGHDLGAEAAGEVDWVRKSREGMEKVVEGLSVF